MCIKVRYVISHLGLGQHRIRPALDEVVDVFLEAIIRHADRGPFTAGLPQLHSGLRSMHHHCRVELFE